MATWDFPLEDESVKEIFIQPEHSDELDLERTVSCFRA